MTKLRWLGHSCLWIESDGHTLIIDPFLTGNPKFTGSLDEAAEGITHVVLTHGHDDHVGDAAAIAALETPYTGADADGPRMALGSRLALAYAGAPPQSEVFVTRAATEDPMVPSYDGGKFPLSTYLAERVRKLLDDRRQWNALPEQVRDWLSLQRDFSRVPAVRELLIETFPRGGKHYMVC